MRNPGDGFRFHDLTHGGQGYLSVVDVVTHTERRVYQGTAVDHLADHREGTLSGGGPAVKHVTTSTL